MPEFDASRPVGTLLASVLVLLVVLLGQDGLALGVEQRREELGWVELALYIAEDLRGGNSGWFVDSWCERIVLVFYSYR